MIAVQGVSMRFGSKVLFDDVTATFSVGRRYRTDLPVQLQALADTDNGGIDCTRHRMHPAQPRDLDLLVDPYRNVVRTAAIADERSRRIEDR